MKREMICVACPIGCRLTADYDNESSEVRITGNQCRKGEEYGREEILSPSRVVTATVALSGCVEQRAPVKTTRALAKQLIPSLLDELYQITLDPPVTLGKAVLTDFAGSGVDVVTTRTIKADPGRNLGGSVDA